MHELSISRHIIEQAARHAEGQRVLRIKLRVGELTAVLPDALAFCFDVAARGSLLEGARLEIEAVDGRARCHGCGEDFHLPPPGARCACGAQGFDLLAGDELKIVELELADDPTSECPHGPRAGTAASAPSSRGQRAAERMGPGSAPSPPRNSARLQGR